jgi:Glycosyl transferase family 2
MSGLPAKARAHAVFLVLLAAGLVLRVLVMVTYRPALLTIDSLGSYLSSLPTLDPSGQDPIGYDVLLLKPVLAVGTLTAVAAVQHLLGLGMAVTTYAVIVHKGGLATRGWRALAALATAPILLDAYQVQIEQLVMSDALFQALLVGAFAVLAWPRRPSWWRAALAGLVLGGAVTVRAVGGPLVLVAVVYVLVIAAGWRRRVLVAGTLAACFALPLLTYAVHFHSATGRYGLSNVGGATLYGRVATFADCTGVDMPPYQRPLCPTVPRAQRLGPDYWAHDPASPATKPITAPPGKTGDQVLQQFSLRIIRHQPVDFARAVLADAVRLFSWQRTDGRDTGQPPIERWRFQTEFQAYPPVVTEQTAADVGARYGGGPAHVVTPLAGALRWYQLHVGYTPGPVMAACLLVALLAAAGVGRARRSPLRRPLLLYLLGGAAVLLLADVFEFSWRYQLPGYVLLPAAAVLGLAALVRRPHAAGGPAFPEPADEKALVEFDERYGAVRLPDVVVLIAAYNEADTLGHVLAQVPARCLGLPITSLVVVDGATDATAEVARAHAGYTCAVPVNRGQGAALRLGYHLARQGGARFIVTTDADGQYDMAELPVLLAPLVAGEADFVTGSRRLGANESTDRVRRLGTRVFAGLVSLLGRQRITDTSFGFRAMRAEVTGAVRLTQPQYQSSELLVGLLCRGYRVVERPMTLRRRAGGRSKKGNNLVYGLRYTRVVLSTWWRERAAARDANSTRSSSANLTRNIAA